MKEQIHAQADLSFDFLSLLAIASILAGIGLITNSTVVIVASMLVSPIMGPVMGMVSSERAVMMLMVDVRIGLTLQFR